ncbi:MAG: 1-deoxy-D-xylulose-5-phosphate synthase N-terminal domain-containing protein [Bacillota bacterium]|nr:1-deoxy-D-xylulose-5-phosphate synthase N-terminal domain-containing protein [Bacillota bacterium]
MSENKDKNLIESLKNMSVSEMYELSNILRKDIIKYVSQNGGHLASNLGAVELTIALHRVFNTPKDKIIFDVGHQCYVHKMLTGRYDDMAKLRNIDGISGFPKISESEHDMFDSGHSGTSIGACLGYAKARDLKNEDYSCIAVIGDGSLTAGVAWEALNMAGASKTPMIVILNDNKMSIDGNVGGISKHLHKLRTSNAYNKFKKSIKSTSNESLQKSLEKIRDAIKFTLVPGAIFEEIGFKYYGPIDGHNINDLIDALRFAKDLNRPVLLHVVTKKGRALNRQRRILQNFMVLEALIRKLLILLRNLMINLGQKFLGMN